MKWIPNALTWLRILLIPLFIWLTFISQIEERIAWALLVFAVASFTDFLDGYLARKWNVISTFGKIADPLADKLLVLSALAALTWLEPFKLPLIIFILIAIRELLVSIWRENKKRNGIIVPADKLGKWKTFLQMAGIIAAMALWAWMPKIPDQYIIAAQIWFAIVALFTIYSAAAYFIPNGKSEKG